MCGVDSGLVHTVQGTTRHINDVIEANAFGDAGYQGASKRPDAKANVQLRIAMRPGVRKELDKESPLGKLLNQIERTKARILAKVEHPFQANTRQLGHVKVLYRGLAKNTVQFHTLFALSNRWMARQHLLGVVTA